MKTSLYRKSSKPEGRRESGVRSVRFTCPTATWPDVKNRQPSPSVANYPQFVPTGKTNGRSAPIQTCAIGAIRIGDASALGGIRAFGAGGNASSATHANQVVVLITGARRLPARAAVAWPSRGGRPKEIHQFGASREEHREHDEVTHASVAGAAIALVASVARFDARVAARLSGRTALAALGTSVGGRSGNQASPKSKNDAQHHSNDCFGHPPILLARGILGYCAEVQR